MGNISYMQLTEYLAIMMNTRQQEKKGLVEYAERFKQEKSIVKSSIGEIVLDSFVETIKEFKKLDEVGDVYKIINIKKNEFEAWSMMVFMIGPDKRKYW